MMKSKEIDHGLFTITDSDDETDEELEDVEIGLQEDNDSFDSQEQQQVPPPERKWKRKNILLAVAGLLLFAAVALFAINLGGLRLHNLQPSGDESDYPLTEQEQMRESDAIDGRRTDQTHRPFRLFQRESWEADDDDY